MALAKFMSGNVIVRSRVFSVASNPDGSRTAIFKSKKWLIFTKKEGRSFYPDEAFEKLVPKKPPTYEAYFDNKSGQQMKKAEVLKGEIDRDRLTQIRDAQTVIQAEKKIDKDYNEDKILDKFMIGIALFIVLILLFVIGVYYQSYATANLTSAIQQLHITNVYQNVTTHVA